MSVLIKQVVPALPTRKVLFNWARLQDIPPTFNAWRAKVATHGRTLATQRDETASPLLAYGVAKKLWDAPNLNHSPSLQKVRSKTANEVKRVVKEHRYREILNARLTYGLTYRALAERFGCSLDTIKRAMGFYKEKVNPQSVLVAVGEGCKPRKRGANPSLRGTLQAGGQRTGKAPAVGQKLVVTDKALLLETMREDRLRKRTLRAKKLSTRLRPAVLNPSHPSWSSQQDEPQATDTRRLASVAVNS